MPVRPAVPCPRRTHRIDEWLDIGPAALGALRPVRACCYCYHFPIRRVVHDPPLLAVMPPGVVVELLAFDMSRMRRQGRALGEQTSMELSIGLEAAESPVLVHEMSVESRRRVVRRIGTMDNERCACAHCSAVRALQECVAVIGELYRRKIESRPFHPDRDEVDRLRHSMTLEIDQITERFRASNLLNGMCVRVLSQGVFSCGEPFVVPENKDPSDVMLIGPSGEVRFPRIPEGADLGEWHVATFTKTETKIG